MFTLANWACVSTSTNQGQETVVPLFGSSTIINSQNVFSYASPNDNVATILGANYFLPVYATLSVGDWILVNGTDSNEILVVQTVSSTSVTTKNIISTGGLTLPLAPSLGGTGVMNDNTHTLTVEAATVIDAAGRIATPVRVSFQAYVQAVIPNVTGDDTRYDIIYDTLVYNNGGGFNLATGVFTAPVAGNYLFIHENNSFGYTSSHTFCKVQLNYNSFTTIYTMGSYNPFNTAGISAGPTLVLGLIGTAIIPMQVGDTVVSEIEVDNGTKVISINGNVNNNATRLSCWLMD